MGLSITSGCVWMGTQPLHCFSLLGSGSGLSGASRLLLFPGRSTELLIFPVQASDVQICSCPLWDFLALPKRIFSLLSFPLSPVVCTPALSLTDSLEIRHKQRLQIFLLNTFLPFFTPSCLSFLLCTRWESGPVAIHCTLKFIEVWIYYTHGNQHSQGVLLEEAAHGAPTVVSYFWQAFLLLQNPCTKGTRVTQKWANLKYKLTFKITSTITKTLKFNIVYWQN